MTIKSSILSFLFVSALLGANENNGLSINGYASLGFSYSDNDNVYYKVDNTSAKINKESSHKLLSDAGIQTIYRYNNLDLTYQASWRENNNDNFDTQAFNIKYTGEYDYLRLGRMRLAIYTYNDILHVKPAYLWTHVPSDLYSLTVSNFDGIEYGRNFFYKDYLFDITLSYGDSPKHTDQNLGETYVDTRVEDVTLFRVAAEKDYFSISSSYFLGKYDFDASIINDFNQLLQVVKPLDSQFVENISNKYTMDNKDIKSISLALKYDNDFLINGEYINIKIEDNVLISNIDAYYLNLGYRFDNITPYIMYANRDQKRYDTSSDENTLKAYAATISQVNPQVGALLDANAQALGDIVDIANLSQSTLSIGFQYSITPNLDFKMQYEKVYLSNKRKGFYESRNGEFDDINVINSTMSYSF